MAQNTSETGLIAKLGLPQAAPAWGLGEMALVIAVLFVGTLIIGTGVTSSIAADPLNPEPVSLLMGWLIGLVVVFVFTLIRWRRTAERFEGLRLQRGHWNPLLAVMVGIAGAFTASVIAGLATGSFVAPLSVLGIEASNFSALFLLGLFVLLVQPLTESLVFYGVVLPRLRTSFGGWAGLIATIVLYAVYYYLIFGTRGTGNIAIWYGAIYPLVIGFTLGAVRIWSQSTLATMLAQIGIGASVLLIVLVS